MTRQNALYFIYIYQVIQYTLAYDHVDIIANRLTLKFKFTLIPLPCGAGSAVPARGLTLVLLFLHHYPSIRCWAAVDLCYGLAIFHIFNKWNVHFHTFLLVNTCQSGTLPSIFGVKYKSCSAGTSIC